MSIFEWSNRKCHLRLSRKSVKGYFFYVKNVSYIFWEL